MAHNAAPVDSATAIRRALDLVNLPPVMEITSGAPEVVVAVLDGPVWASHSDFVGTEFRQVGNRSGACAQPHSPACIHGTGVMGILAARRGSVAPAICPGCTFLLRPIFSELAGNRGLLPVTAAELGLAIVECVELGARIINLSLALIRSYESSLRILVEALDHAARRGVVVVAATGNQGAVGASAITRHPAVIPVAAYGLNRQPTRQTNLGGAIGRWGVGAPGESVVSLGTDRTSVVLGGTSAAAPFVTGVAALLWSGFVAATATEVRIAIREATGRGRITIVPPLVDAWKAYQALQGRELGGRTY